jgi:hypothetical protein
MHIYRILARKPEGKRPLGRPRLCLDDSIEMDWVGCGLDLPSSGYGPVAGSCDHGNEIQGAVKCW